MLGTAVTVAIGALVGAVIYGVLKRIRKAARRRRKTPGEDTQPNSALRRRLRHIEKEVKRFGACRNAQVVGQRRVLDVMSELNRIVMAEPSASQAYRDMLPSFVETVNASSGHTILEIGSRNVTGNPQKPKFHGYREYVGLDFHPGENVDVVGDAHRLSEYFPPGHFDFVISVSVFEHLAMPWKVVLEVNKVMKDGGLFFVGTHPTWPGHEKPWDFWRFSKEAFGVLLNEKTGFSLIRAEEGVPSAVFSLEREEALFDLFRSPASLRVCALARKVGPCSDDLCWDVQVEEILDTRYPEPPA